MRFIDRIPFVESIDPLATLRTSLLAGALIVLLGPPALGQSRPSQTDSPAGPLRSQTAPPARALEPTFLQRQQPTPLAPRPVVRDLEHTVIHYDKGTYCGHPRMVIFQQFAGDEIVVGHFHAPCRYQEYADVRHINYQNRSVCLLQRSRDGGRTWRPEDEVVLFDHTMSPDRKRAFLNQADAPRERYDMSRPDSAFFFNYAYLTTRYETEVPAWFSLRSPDRGRTWEKTPTILANPHGREFQLERHNTPVIRMPDGKTLLMALQMADAPGERGGEPAVFSSTDNGLSWQLLSRPLADRSGAGHFNYVSLLLRPDGQLHCYTLHLAKGGDEQVGGLKNAITLVTSRNGGKTWSRPVPIVGKGGNCWKNERGTGVIYRSPYPIQLKDGRILVLFARRRLPGGIGGIVSSDGGKTWSEEFVLRDDGQWWDLGYPVGCQLDDGRILTIYYFNRQDGNKEGGTRYIAGTFFRLE